MFYMPTADDIRHIAAPILQKAGIRRAGIFGSAARGEARDGSDIDILIEPADQKRFSLFDLVGVKQSLEEALKRKVDVIDYRGIKPLLRESILEDEVPIL